MIQSPKTTEKPQGPLSHTSSQLKSLRTCKTNSPMHSNTLRRQIHKTAAYTSLPLQQTYNVKEQKNHGAGGGIADRRRGKQGYTDLSHGCQWDFESILRRRVRPRYRRRQTQAEKHPTVAAMLVHHGLGERYHSVGVWALTAPDHVALSAGCWRGKRIASIKSRSG